MAGLDVTGALRGRRNHHDAPKDTSSRISRSIRRCALSARGASARATGAGAFSVHGRGFGSKVAASQNEPFMASECVSCGACVEACPTVALTEKTVIQAGRPDRVATTTCAYCGVGCSFNVEMQDDRVVRMVPNRNGHANHGHACVKGRFAFGYATHPDRITTPMIRSSIHEPWQQVAGTGDRTQFRRIQAKRPRRSAASRRRCTNEGLLRRSATTSTPARVCHSPTGYGLNIPSANRPARRRSTQSCRPTRSSSSAPIPPGPSGVRLAAQAPSAAGRQAHRDRSRDHWRARHIEATCRRDRAPTSPCSTRWRLVVTEGLTATHTSSSAARPAA